jgi:hypothetical protein
MSQGNPHNKYMLIKMLKKKKKAHRSKNFRTSSPQPTQRLAERGLVLRAPGEGIDGAQLSPEQVTGSLKGVCSEWTASLGN